MFLHFLKTVNLRNNIHRVFLGSVVLGALSLMAGSSLAHDDAYLDSKPSKHGGQVRMTGIYHIELVVTTNSPVLKDNSLEIYVTDHAGNQVSTTGATGTITLFSGKLKSNAALTADGENRLIGHAQYASSEDLKMVVSIKMAGSNPVQARFTPFAAKTSQTGHSH